MHARLVNTVHKQSLKSATIELWQVSTKYSPYILASIQNYLDLKLRQEKKST